MQEMQEMWVRSLSQEDPLDWKWIGNGNPLQYSSLENPWTEEPGGLQSTGAQRVRQAKETLQAPTP